mgnify:CR=1 FL=1|tara:strand:- start:432 stop:635 length:204 start_codon:yes stop_codon:yes gene_type:complete
MATIDDLQEQATVKVRLGTDYSAEAPVETVSLRIEIPRTLLDTVSGGDTRSRVMVRDWIKVAVDAKD